MTRVLLAAGAALLLTAGAASAAPAAHSPLSALDGAKTVQVTETMMAPHSPAEPLRTVETLRVKIQQPGQARIEHTPAGASAPDGVLVTDGKTLTEYDVASKQYHKVASPPLAVFGYDGIYALGPYPATAKSVATNLTGKSALLYTIIEKRNGQSFTRKLWVDASSRLPLRQSILTGTGAKAKEVLRTLFANWALDKPLQTAVFAFNPPAGVTEYKEPTMPEMPPNVTVTTPDAPPTAPAMPDVPTTPTAPAAPPATTPVTPPAPVTPPTVTPTVPPTTTPAAPPM